MTTHTATYSELLRQRADLERQIVIARKVEAATAINKARALVEEFGLNQEDVFPLVKPTREKHQSVPKYRDPISGRTWTGRGRPPAWILNLDRTHFSF